MDVLPPNPVVTLGRLVWTSPGLPVEFTIPLPAASRSPASTCSCKAC